MLFSNIIAYFGVPKSTKDKDLIDGGATVVSSDDDVKNVVVYKPDTNNN